MQWELETLNMFLILNHRINLIATEYFYDKASLVSISYLLS